MKCKQTRGSLFAAGYYALLLRSDAAASQWRFPGRNAMFIMRAAEASKRLCGLSWNAIDKWSAEREEAGFVAHGARVDLSDLLSSAYRLAKT